MRRTLLATALLAVAAAAPVHAEPFTLMIFEAPADFAARTDPAKAPGYWAAYGAYAEALQKAGTLRGGMPLHPDALAKTSAVRDGRVSVTQIASTAGLPEPGGYFMIDVDTLETALAWAAKAPAVATGRVEVRAGNPAPAMR